MEFCKNLKEIRLSDAPIVGGKNSSLGQMIADLSAVVAVPGGFAITVAAYWYVLDQNNILTRLTQVLQGYDAQRDSIKQLQIVGKQARALVESVTLPDDLVVAITQHYQELCDTVGVQNCSVAVRSSATAEDLPNASFAGQQESYLNICGIDALLHAYRDCIASLFTDRAIAYRIEKKFDHFAVGISVGVQQMVRSDLGSAGVMFTLDTESGFKNSIVITGSYGLGESVVRGEVIPDEFHVFKPMLVQEKDPIIKKTLGSKTTKRVFGKNSSCPVVLENVVQTEQAFCITDAQVVQLAHMAVAIEDYYSKLYNRWCPMDIEWAQDGITKKFYIVQARPETVHSFESLGQCSIETFTIHDRGTAQVIVTGQSVGKKLRRELLL